MTISPTAAPLSHHAAVDSTSSSPKQILLVVANPSLSTTLGWPVGFWAAELTHPYYEFTEAGFEVTIASPAGGKVDLDQLSDPRDERRWSADDLMPWRIEDAARERGANYVQAGRFKPFAVRDGRLITGQQQYSSRKVAQLVIEALGR